MDEEVVLALGSNLGDRLRHLGAGVRLLREVVDVTRLSSVVESAPEGAATHVPQPDYLNAVLRARCGVQPAALLSACLRAERSEGRRRGVPGAPRTLDVDLLFFGDRIVRRPGLTVPHPRWRERGFVLRPLLEIAPGWRDPETGETVEDVCRQRPSVLERARVVAAPDALEEAG